MSTNSPAVTLIGHNESVYDVACSPVEPGILASCGGKGMVALWDARSRGVYTNFKKVSLFDPHTFGTCQYIRRNVTKDRTKQ